MTASHAGTCGCCTPATVEAPEPEPTPSGDDAVCYCPIDGLIDTVSKKYAMQIVSVVGAREPVRFKDLEALFEGASTSTLSNRLEELVEVDVLERTSFDEVPPHVEYRLTTAGRELQARLEPLLEWVAEADRSSEPPSTSESS